MSDKGKEKGKESESKVSNIRKGTSQNKYNYKRDRKVITIRGKEIVRGMLRLG